MILLIFKDIHNTSVKFEVKEYGKVLCKLTFICCLLYFELIINFFFL